MKDPLSKIIIKYSNGWAQAYYYSVDGSGFAMTPHPIQSEATVYQAQRMLRKEIGVEIGPIDPARVLLTINFPCQ